jgi:phenylalanyl-tRNA synthetase beta chain
LPAFTIQPPVQNELRALERKAAEVLAQDFAFTEVYNYSFVSGDQIKKFGEDPALSLELDNPLSKEKPFLRRSLLPNLLEVIKKNADYNAIGIFEIGQIYQKELPGLRVSSGSNELLPREDVMFSAIYHDRKNERPFSEVKKIYNRLSYLLGMEAVATPTSSLDFSHPARAEEYKIGESVIGHCFELHPKVAQDFGVEGRVGILNLNLSLLASLLVGKKVNHYELLSPYPEVSRDLAFMVDKKITNAEIVGALVGLDQILKKVELFDDYEDERGDLSKKSLAYHFVFSHPSRTLTSEEVGKVEEQIKTILQQKFQVEFR